MPRSHALQAREGNAHGLHIRVPDGELIELEQLARGATPPTTVSSVVREAIARHLRVARGRSPFFKVFARFIEDLADVGVRPVLGGPWAAAAHGYLAPCESFDLVVAPDDVRTLTDFLVARGAPSTLRLPLRLGRRPWQVTLALSFGGADARGLPVQTFEWDTGELRTITLDGLLALGEAALPDYTIDALREIKAGRHPLDDGERGVVAWDAVGRMTASAAFPDRRTREPYRFVDLRKVARR